MSQNVHFSSATNEWATPQDFFDKLNMQFDFNLDPCATAENAKCEKFFTIEDNGLEQDWSKYRVFCNPPYGRGLKDWVRKAYEESKKGALVVMLIPARTDTSYWHDYVVGGGRRCSIFTWPIKIWRKRKFRTFSIGFGYVVGA